MPGPFPYEWLTFDCYGTLIDWEEGIWRAFKPLLEKASRKVSLQEFLALYGELESEEERVWRPYRDVLRAVCKRMAQILGIDLAPREEEILLESLPSWKPFPEVNEALVGLKERGFSLAIISNIDNDLLAHSLRHFAVDFDLLITAEDARCYKPHQAIFSFAFQRLSVSPPAILHVAQSLFHDISPASSQGWRTCWVKRPGRDPYGATPKAFAQPDFIISNLLQLIDLLEK